MKTSVFNKQSDKKVFEGCSKTSFLTPISTQTAVWPRESVAVPLIALLYTSSMYRHFVIESDGDSFLEAGEKKRTGEMAMAEGGEEEGGSGRRRT